MRAPIDRPCQWPGCAAKAPHNGNFCVEHYFEIDAKQAQVLTRMRLQAIRSGDAEDHARIDSYARRAAELAMQARTNKEKCHA